MKTIVYGAVITVSKLYVMKQDYYTSIVIW